VSLVCATNDVPELRPCVVAKAHSSGCTGFASRWDAETAQRITVWTVECKGCLPALAEHGCLCFSCWMKLNDGLNMAVDVITHLRSVDRAAQTDNAGVRVAAGWVIPIPSTWRAADDLMVLIGCPAPGFLSTDDVNQVQAITEEIVARATAGMVAWVATVDGARDAVRFNAVMHSALIQHPMEDYEHRVRNVRCTDCGQRSLMWKPPLMFHGEVRVECTNAACAFVVDQTGYKHLTAIEALDVKARLDVERKRISAEKRAVAKAGREAVKLEREAARAAQL